MKRRSIVFSQFMLTILILSCIFGNLFSFLDVDLGFVVLTPFRFILFLTGIYCLYCWVGYIKRKEFAVVLKQNRVRWCSFGFFAIWFALGVAWIIFGSVSEQAFPDVLGIFTTCALSFCCFTLVKNQNDINHFLFLIELSGLILAILACIEVVCGSFVPGTRYYFTLAQKIASNQTFYAPTTVFHNQNDFAAFMLLCLSISCYRILSSKTSWGFFWRLVGSCLLIVPTILSDSSVYYLSACALALLTVLALLLLRSGSWKSRLIRASAVALVAIVFALACNNAIRSAAVELNKRYFAKQINAFQAQTATTEPSSPTISEVIEETSDPCETTDVTDPTIPTWIPPEVKKPDTIADQVNAYENNYGSIHIRLWLIRAGWDFCLDNPLFGNGPASFSIKMQENREYFNQARGYINPHCFYTELLSQYGMILFAIYMGIILYLFVRSGFQTIRELRNGCPGWGLLCLFLIGTFSVAIMMPSSIVRFTSIWLFLILAVNVFDSKVKTV